MRKGIIILIIGLLAWRWYVHQGRPPSDAPQPSPVPADMSFPGTLVPARDRAAAGSTAEITREFEELFDGESRFETLAKPGHYTVVEIYLDTCPICRRLESTYPAFLEARTDVIIRKVHFPEHGMNMQIQGQTREEVEAEAKRIQGLIGMYAVCGTPHVEVYGPDGAILAADRCGDKAGLNYLRAWIHRETGLDAGSGTAFTRTSG